jgi:hypothetical protein
MHYMSSIATWPYLVLSTLCLAGAPLDEAAVMTELSLGDPPSIGAVVHVSDLSAEDFDIPISVTREVENWIGYFLGPGRPVLQLWRQRLSEHGPQIRRELQKAKLPNDLVYLPLIESGLNPQARSRLGALGVWQFLPDTARAFGLVVDEARDERTDVARSTQGALSYLTRLHQRFGDWELALTAYNGGPTMLADLLQENNGQKPYGPRESQNVVKRHLADSLGFHRHLQAPASTSCSTAPLVLGDVAAQLSPETRNYVPKIVAVAILDRYADRYGLDE